MSAHQGRRTVMAAAATATIIPLFPRARATVPTQMLLDDMAGASTRSRLGTRWAGFTDQVMGGRSTGGASYDTILGRRCLRLSGNVNTKGGGFIQLALDLEPGGVPLDASAFEGFEMDVWGNGEEYNCHIRTTDVGWYEQSYRATFASKPEWQTLRLPWSAFIPHGLNAPLNLRGLQRVAVLGWMRNFDADVAVARIALY
jgi:Complex I intermediate-associated protein 30 (CIA30)